MSEITIDAAVVRGGGAALSRTEERLVEMTNGCICCTLRDDLLEEAERLALEGRFDYPLIESGGISEPMPVAAAFSFARDDGTTPEDLTRLDTMATVVDAAEQARPRRRRLGRSPARRPDPAQPGRPSAGDRTGTGARPRCARDRRLRRRTGATGPGLGSTLFRADRPFHPGRLWELVTERLDSGAFGSVLRGKGFFTPAGRAGVTGLWSQAGGVARFEPAGGADPFPPWEVQGARDACVHGRDGVALPVRGPVGGP